MKLLGLMLSALIFFACASTISPSPKQRFVGEDPTLNSRTQRSVGVVIYEIYNYEQRMVARLDAPLSIRRSTMRGSMPANSILSQFSSTDEILYCAGQPILRHGGIFGVGPPVYDVCLSDQNGDGAFDSWVIPGSKKRQTLETSVQFAIQVSGADVDGFKYELLYQGIAGEVVGLLYREYINDLARPAFYQNLSYTLAPSGTTEVSFRDIRIRIYGADNNSIDYEVLAGLNEELTN